MNNINEMYRRTFDEFLHKESYSLRDFGNVCLRMKLPFFEVEEIVNPFSGEQTTNKHVYDGYEEFRGSMPGWSAREYDYENDCAGAYCEIDGIHEGCFNVRASNNSMSYSWSFLVTDVAVLVRTMKTFID